MTDRDRLLRMLSDAARPAPRRKRSIVCYDSKWAGLPRVTIYDRPRRRKVGRRKPRWVAARSPHSRRAMPVQMELAL
jgi:hypothetical protein